ncbi:uncharacterized protein LOC107771935 [Nicotiana tabacum]|uniref:Uncharacterized protein LOC107771935 n=1 Tax=Nicotiana tabacum TaxID=4097 RepID=A0A1S3Y3Z6_TOBAC|nr:uncharacterized protein LOC104099944 [Nicotiana tomentosiformis]XP_009605375.1 uncharacterized protein LOC104099944 [Nicotiana tomentosiformis]
MSELRFQDQRLSLIFGGRDVSPDSVIFTADSSASPSLDRCSFTSLSHHPLSHHLTGYEFHEALGGPPPDLSKAMVHKNSHLRRKEKTKVREEKNLTLDSARKSFSQALKECQDRRSKAENKLDRQKPDLNNAIIKATHSSPRIGVMKKTIVTASGTCMFPSPGTPNYRHYIQKGWSSEHVPLRSAANRRQLNTALLPYNNGRTLPSKWEDAERWIFSPASGDRGSLQQRQRRPKSKSGPLGPAYYSLYSPIVPVFKGGNGGNLLASSPRSSRVIAADSSAFRSGGNLGGGNFPSFVEPCMARSLSVHGCSELLSLSTLSIPQDESSDDIEDATNGVSRIISRRDMATQMSPEESPSSPLRLSPFSPSTPSVLPIVKLQRVTSSKAEVRDVPVDECGAPTPGREIRSSHWDVSNTTKSASKIRREEARITAWENLQKAKAEAAIRKLEMKLEKKRSSSMDKIMNKFKSAQRKAQEMRSSMSANQANEVTKSSQTALSFHRTRQLGSLSGCFTCHAS